MNNVYKKVSMLLGFKLTEIMTKEIHISCTLSARWHSFTDVHVQMAMDIYSAKVTEMI